MPFSEAYAHDLLDAEFGSGSPADHEIALFTSAPNADGSGGTEVAGGSYARAVVTNNNTNWPAASGREKKNGAAITFVQATGNWGAISHVKIMDGSDVKYFGPLTTPRTVNNGDTFSFAIDQLVVTLS